MIRVYRIGEHKFMMTDLKFYMVEMTKDGKYKVGKRIKCDNDISNLLTLNKKYGTENTRDDNLKIIKSAL